MGRDYKLAEAACVDSVTGCLPGSPLARHRVQLVPASRLGCARSGAVPPFGSVFTPPVPTIVDPSLVDQGDEITFNAVRPPCLAPAGTALTRTHVYVQGLRTHSIKMRVSDYLRVEVPTVVEFVADAV